VNFIIAITFQKALDRLNAAEQAIVKQAVFDFQMNPKSPGFSFEDLQRAKDKDLWSFRASGNLRIIVHRTPATFTLCYVDHHDKAYKWAESRKVVIHPATGAMQIVEVVERTEEHVKRVVREELVDPPAMRRFDREYIFALGVPEEWLDAVMTATEDELDRVLPRLPQEAAERLLELVCGIPVPIPEKQSGDFGFSHPDAQRRFRVVESEDELRKALDAPWAQWMVFLHPSQRKVVERAYRGPARVSGAAGTGKTVVALHRAAELLRRYPNSRILLTTFSRTLALKLAIQARTLLGEDSAWQQRLRIEHLHKVARDVVAAGGDGVTVMDNHALTGLLSDAIDATGQRTFEVRFLRAEWESVVDPAGIDNWDQYRGASRSNRGMPMGARQRVAAWKVFGHVLETMRRSRMTTWNRLCIEAAKVTAHSPLFEHVIADEYQDLGVAEMRFLRAAARKGGDDLFLCGDSGQRIYKPAFSWLSLGIDIRGRSSNLQVNYRTTEQIRRFADQIVATSLDGSTGEPEIRSSVSLLQGTVPEVLVAQNQAAEVKLISKWLVETVRSGVQPAEIAVFGRTEAIIRKRAEAALADCGMDFRSLNDEGSDNNGGAISVGTMHRAKGLEFRAVAVVGCDDEVLPLESVLGEIVDGADRNNFLEQERQLLYVACTRARERLLVSASGKASRFLDRITSI
jgi:mRNA-degrading endonuclease RelE of RelBE toxin-antitoxin system